MIMDTAETGVVEGNMPIYRESTMGISEAAKRHIMRQLSSFYNDPMRAVLREYYANAIDSHKKAGIDLPVEVQLPSALHPTFWVRDRGVGMSEDFIDGIFNQYGESTKQDEEGSIGHFGFGSKSGFAIASQFSVISYYNGMKYSMNYVKAADGSYRGDIVSARETDEPNGVLVSVPIDQDRVNSFNATAATFFQYVDPKSVLVNGKNPTSIFEQGKLTKLAVDGGVEVWADTAKRTYSPYYSSPRTFQFVMGGIAYDISAEQYTNSLSRLNISSLEIYDAIFVIPLGTINIGGTREGVQDTKKTNDMLDKCIRLLVDSLKVVIQDKIDKLSDYSEVMSVFDGAKRIVVDNSIPFTYKNKPVTDIITLDDPVMAVRKTVGISLNHDYITEYHLDRNSTIVTGVDDPEIFLTKEKNSFLHYAKSLGNSISITPVTSLDDLIPEDEQFKITENKNKTVITYQEFKDSVKEYRALMREAAAARKAAGTDLTALKKTEVRLAVLDLETDTLSWPEVSSLDAGDLVYVWSRQMPEPHHWDNGTMRQAVTKYISVFDGEKTNNALTRLSKTLKVLTEKKKVVLLAGTRTPSFLEKNLSGVRSIIDEIKETLDEYEKGMTAESIKKLETATHSFTAMIKVSFPRERINEIEDEELREALIGAPTDQGRTRLNEYLQALEGMRFSVFETWALRRRFKYENRDSGTDFREKYPLMEYHVRYSYIAPKTLDHLVKYINSTYRDLISEQNAATLKTTKG